MRKIFACMVLGILVTVAGASAAVPQEVGYQGYLTDAAGVPVTGNLIISFSLYAADTGGTPLWTESQTVTIDKGIYSISLGAVTPLTLPFDTRYYLGIRVDNDPAELSPRQPLASTPYAHRAKSVEVLDAGSVTDATITGTISGNKLGSHAHSGADISSGTLPDARLAGSYTHPLSLSNVDNSFTGNGANLSGLNASSLASGTISDARLSANVQMKYGKVAVVAASGANYTSPVTAMGDIAAWCGTPSATNPCLLKILPGVYDIGGSTLFMQQYVDIEGSGEKVTTISGSVNNASSPPANGVVNGASNTEIRFLTVKNTGTGTSVAALVNINASPKIIHVTASVSGGGYSYAVYNSSSSPIMSNVVASASSASNANNGIFNTSSSPTMNNVSASAFGGFVNSGVYNTSSSSPIMSNVTASSSGGSYSYGVYNSSSSPTMNNVTSSASGATNSNYGMANTTSSSPNITNVTATASGGTASYGVSNISSSPTMSNVIASANNGSSNYGMYNTASSGSYTMHIDRSTFEGSTNSILNDTEFTLKIGGSKLVGPTSNVGNSLYLASYSDTSTIDSAMIGTQTFQTGTAATTGLVVKGATEQSANLQEWQNSAGTPVASVSPAGVLTGSGAGLTNLNASNLTSGTVPDARLSATVQKKYGKVAVVAQSGGDYTSPITAMNGIAAWCGTPSASNPCLLKIMPGVYDIGGSTVIMQQYVDIEGSGEKVTTISGSVNNASSPPANGVVNGASNAEIRFLTVKNTGSGAYVPALLNTNASPKLTNVTASASGATNHNIGVYNYSSSPTIINVTSSASGGTSSFGVYNSSSSAPAMSNVTASASGGTYSNFGVYNSSSSPAMSKVTASASGEGTYFNHGVFNISSSPTMSNVIASASGATNDNYGVYNLSSSPAMTNVTASASGGSSSFGVYNSTSAPIMTNVTASASGGTYNSYGVRNDSSSPTMSNVIASAKNGATTNYGMYMYSSSGTYTTLIDRSTFEGSTNSIFNAAGFNLKIGGSKLTGGAVNAVGTYTCVGVYNGDTYTALGPTCQ